ncbi:MAG: diguanylate cyclase [Dehalococcoidia bacterium]
MTLGTPRTVLAMPGPDQPKLERQVLILQSTIAGFFVVGVLLGWFGTHSLASRVGAAWIAGYHVVHAVYILRYRIPGRPLRWAEGLTPILDVSCITTAWVVLDQAVSPFWAVYLYALVGYGRRYHGRRYFLLASFIVANVVFGRLTITANNGQAMMVNADLLTMVVITAAMASLSHAVGSAWRHAELKARTLAETDPLTGIANRRFFLERLEETSQDENASFALLMLDLDDFKRINDEYGHMRGDDVLAQVAFLLSQNIRGNDEVARYGGEEFVIAMPETSLTEATAMADRLRALIFAATPASISIGCAVREAGESFDSVLKRADDLLLSAKRTGKNAVRSSTLRRAG